MRRPITAFFIFALMFGGLSVTAASATCYEDSSLDQAGDWVRTFGKKGIEKDQILARRKADRMLACAQKDVRKASKEAGKVTQDMKKRFGL